MTGRMDQAVCGQKRKQVSLISLQAWGSVLTLVMHQRLKTMKTMARSLSWRARPVSVVPFRHNHLLTCPRARQQRCAALLGTTQPCATLRFSPVRRKQLVSRSVRSHPRRPFKCGVDIKRRAAHDHHASIWIDQNPGHHLCTSSSSRPPPRQRVWDAAVC